MKNMKKSAYCCIVIVCEKDEDFLVRPLRHRTQAEGFFIARSDLHRLRTSLRHKNKKGTKKVYIMGERENPFVGRCVKRAKI